MINNIFKVFVIIFLVILFYCNINNIENFSSNNRVKNTNNFLSKEIKDKMINIFRIIIKVLNENNIEYFINYGTLLGKCRHDNIIPWDDELIYQLIKLKLKKLIQ